MGENIYEKVGTRLGNVDDLPEELRKQIPEFIIDGIDAQVYKVLKEDLEGIGSLSEIMVALYRRFKISDKSRVEITDAVYRLIRKRMVKGVKGRKAIYALISVETNLIDQSAMETDGIISKNINQELT